MWGGFRLLRLNRRPHYSTNGILSSHIFPICFLKNLSISCQAGGVPHLVDLQCRFQYAQTCSQNHHLIAQIDNDFYRLVIHSKIVF